MGVTVYSVRERRAVEYMVLGLVKVDEQIKISLYVNITLYS